ncbi:hypothetical protein K2X30_10475 [bacterium]|jgi:hypothetical protein|nr:hypothetical protein [bacterium]
MKKNSIVGWGFVVLAVSLVLGNSSRSAEIQPVDPTPVAPAPVVPAPVPVPAPVMDPAVVAQVKAYFEQGYFGFATWMDEAQLADAALAEYTALKTADACAKSGFCPELFEEKIANTALAVIYWADQNSYLFSIYTADGKTVVAKGKSEGNQPFIWSP